MKSHCYTEILHKSSKIIMHYDTEISMAHRDLIIQSYIFRILASVLELLSQDVTIEDFLLECVDG